ncbi:uncharacterized protein [Venturia canescens]|uniref:uncharacterized protein n=1 Tax=Venturia canescens TaxID=32260 RepID=UPI001C9C1EA5|nr:uncharacterized protein LOC122411110 [Venturia canescens]
MAKTKRKPAKSRKPKPMRIAALIVSAIHDLQETKGSTPRKIAGYISYSSNVPEERVKRQVNAALKRGVEYGILRRYRGHYFLPSGDELDRANRIAVRFARLPTPAPSSFTSSVGKAAHRAIESAAEITGYKERNNLFTKGGKLPNRTRSLPESTATSGSEKLFGKEELAIVSDLE